MARRAAEDDEWDDEDDFDDPSDDDDTIPCPYCQRPIHDDAQRCPYCENYISEEDGPRAAKPWWIVAGVILCLLVLYLWIVGG